MAEVDVPRFLAGRIRSAGRALHTACEKMPEDRLAWHPTVEGNVGREAIDQAVECAYINGYAAGAFQAGTVPAFDEKDYKATTAERKTDRQSALRWLHETTNSLASAIEQFPANRFGDTVQNPITGQPTTWAELADFMYWNTVYHEGQVNYIQVLYGDMS